MLHWLEKPVLLCSERILNRDHQGRMLLVPTLGNQVSQQQQWPTKMQIEQTKFIHQKSLQLINRLISRRSLERLERSHPGGGSDRLLPEHRQPTEIGRKSGTVYNKDNTLINSSLFVWFFCNSDIHPNQTGGTTVVKNNKATADHPLEGFLKGSWKSC